MAGWPVGVGVSEGARKEVDEKEGVFVWMGRLVSDDIFFLDVDLRRWRSGVSGMEKVGETGDRKSAMEMMGVRYWYQIFLSMAGIKDWQAREPAGIFKLGGAGTTEVHVSRA